MINDLREIIGKAVFLELEKAGVMVVGVDLPGAVLSALSSSGYVIVPREPTEAMDEAGYQAMLHWPEDWHLGPPKGITSEWFQARQVYRWMIAAALPDKEG